MKLHTYEDDRIDEVASTGDNIAEWRRMPWVKLSEESPAHLEVDNKLDIQALVSIS
jgi:hypothetical protein